MITKEDIVKKIKLEMQRFVISDLIPAYLSENRLTFERVNSEQEEILFYWGKFNNITKYPKELTLEKDYTDWFGEKIFYYSVVDKSDLLLCTYESLVFNRISGNAYKLISKRESISIWKNL